MTNNSCLTLWRAVIKQAVDDFRQGKLQKSYFSSESFGVVCELAGTTPHTFTNVVDIRSVWK